VQLFPARDFLLIFLWDTSSEILLRKNTSYVARILRGKKMKSHTIPFYFEIGGWGGILEQVF